VAVNRNAIPAGVYQTLIPQKRAAARIEENYQGLSQYTRAVAEEQGNNDAAAAQPLLAHRPVNKRFASATVASVYKDKPVNAGSTHLDSKLDDFSAS
jgi:hypothetical protein